MYTFYILVIVFNKNVWFKSLYACTCDETNLLHNTNPTNDNTDIGYDKHCVKPLTHGLGYLMVSYLFGSNNCGIINFAGYFCDGKRDTVLVYLFELLKLIAKISGIINVYMNYYIVLKFNNYCKHYMGRPGKRYDASASLRM